MEARVEKELEAVLGWARAMRDGMEREPARSREFQMQGHAYVGGVLTTLDHLRLITAEEHRAWWERLIAVLGDPPGGWVTFRVAGDD